MTLSHIVAVSKNDVIGVQNGLPWDIPEDMQFFKDTTKGHIMIMGRKTFESVGHPLPNRLSIIITRQKDYQVPPVKPTKPDNPTPTQLLVATDLRSAIEMAKPYTKQYGQEIFIIGGGEIFKDSMNIVDTIYLTRIHKDFEGDVLYPKVDMDFFKEVDRKDRTEPVPFSFLTYKKR